MVDLPIDFLKSYISNVINTCQNIKDKQAQHRMIKLVCVFLQNLIKKKSPNITPLYSSIQSFCVGNSNISEVDTLSKLLKE